MARRIQSTDQLLAPAVAETIEQLEPADTDAAAVQLARRYAEIIDRAEAVAAEADAAFALLALDDIDGRRYLAKIVAKVEAQTVLAELGPKLLAVLESLAATPAGRAKVKGGASKSGPSRLQGLRAARGA